MTPENGEVRDYFNSIAGQWDQTNYCDPEKLRRIVELANIHSDDRVLDVACGTGILVDFLLEKTDYVLGLDLSEKMIDIARLKYKNSKAEFLCCDFYNFTGGPFDVVILHNAYPHFQNKEHLVIQAAHAVKPGGRFLVAHSMGREALNRVHGAKPGKISSRLRPAAEEAALFSKCFCMDIVLDEPGFYCFSGLKRKE